VGCGNSAGVVGARSRAAGGSVGVPVLGGAFACVDGLPRRLSNAGASNAARQGRSFEGARNRRAGADAAPIIRAEGHTAATCPRGRAPLVRMCQRGSDRQRQQTTNKDGQAAIHAGVNVGHPLQVTPVLRSTPHVLPLSSGRQSRMLTPANYKTLHEPKPFPLRRKSLRQLAFRTPARRCGSSPASHVFNRGRSRAAGDKTKARHWMQLGVVACSAGLLVHQVNVLVGLGLDAPRPSADS
jgi:hypothetical protein